MATDDVVLEGRFRRDLRTPTAITIEVPAFVLCVLEARVREANESCLTEDAATVEDYIESELANLVTLRDVVELDLHIPGLAEAVHIDDIALMARVLHQRER
jgi:hypothetical protein